MNKERLTLKPLDVLQFCVQGLATTCRGEDAVLSLVNENEGLSEGAKMVYLTEKSFLNKKAELDYLTKVRRPRLARLLLSLPLIEESARRQIEGQRVLVEDEIAKLIAVIRRARVIRGVDIERASIGGKSKIKWLADD